MGHFGIPVISQVSERDARVSAPAFNTGVVSSGPGVPGGAQYWVLVLDDATESYRVRSVHGPYMSE